MVHEHVVQVFHFPTVLLNTSTHHSQTVCVASPHWHRNSQVWISTAHSLIFVVEGTWKGLKWPPKLHSSPGGSLCSTYCKIIQYNHELHPHPPRQHKRARLSWTWLVTPDFFVTESHHHQIQSVLDPVLRYGAPGVEFMGLHDENAAVTQVHFLPHQVQSKNTHHTANSFSAF